jgi:tripartite-type tricarboxylate transporter receptor subunit TctC
VIRLNRELVEIIRAPEVASLLASQALVPVAGTPDEFAAFFRDQIAKWAKVLRPSGSLPE